MTAQGECLRAAELLARLDDEEGREPTDAEMESAAAHLESCVDCGVSESAPDELLAGVREFDTALPAESVFAANAEQIMAAVRAEPARRAARRAGRVSRGVRPAVRRRRLVGTAMALAACVALIVGIRANREDPAPPAQFAEVEVAPSIEVVSVADVDPAELSASDDAWLIASYDIFDLDIADSDWQVEDLSDEELDALEGVFGSAPSLG